MLDPSLRVVQGSIVWRQHMRGECQRWKWEVLGRRGHSEAKIALAVPAWHHNAHRTVFYRLDGNICTVRQRYMVAKIRKYAV